MNNSLENLQSHLFIIVLNVSLYGNIYSIPNLIVWRHALISRCEYFTPTRDVWWDLGIRYDYGDDGDDVYYFRP